MGSSTSFHTRGVRTLAIAAAACLCLTATGCEYPFAAPAHDASVNSDATSLISATPEADSLVLFGVGLVGAATVFFRRHRH